MEQRPLILFILAMSTTFPVALSLRMCALADSDALAGCLVVIALGIVFYYHQCWHPDGMALLGVSLREWTGVRPHGANSTYTFAMPTDPPRDGWTPETAAAIQAAAAAADSAAEKMPPLL